MADETIPPFADPAVAAAFDAHAPAVRETLLAMRRLIFEAADGADGVGLISETLKWGQPAYRPVRNGIGTTVRIDHDKSAPDACALYVHCQTSLLDMVRSLYPDAFRYQGNRALIVTAGAPLPEAEIRHCAALAFTYHRARTSAPA